MLISGGNGVCDVGFGVQGGGGWGGEKSGLIGLGCEVWGMWGEGSGMLGTCNNIE